MRYTPASVRHMVQTKECIPCAPRSEKQLSAARRTSSGWSESFSNSSTMGIATRISSWNSATHRPQYVTRCLEYAYRALRDHRGTKAQLNENVNRTSTTPQRWQLLPGCPAEIPLHISLSRPQCVWSRQENSYLVLRDQRGTCARRNEYTSWSRNPSAIP
jgi:hypothetical protein